MSELKAVHVKSVYEAYTKTGDDDAAQVYLKSEADKVIEELKEKAEHDCAHWKMQFENSKTSLRETDEACLQYNLERNYSNYKRCLAIANGCKDKIKYWHIRYTTAAGYDRSYEKWKHRLFIKWRNRWLAVSYKFKEAK